MARAIRRSVIPVFVLVLLGVFTGKTQAAGAQDEMVFNAVDIVWVMICAFLVFFLQGLPDIYPRSPGWSVDWSCWHHCVW